MESYNRRLLDEKIERKLKSIDEAAENLQKLLNRLTPEKAAQCTSLNVLIAGSLSYTRSDGINVVSLGHLYA